MVAKTTLLAGDNKVYRQYHAVTCKRRLTAHSTINLSLTWLRFLLFRYSAKSSITQEEIRVKKLSPTERYSSEVARALSWRFYLLIENGGLSWCLSSSPSWSVHSWVLHVPQKWGWLTIEIYSFALFIGSKERTKELMSYACNNSLPE